MPDEPGPDEQGRETEETRAEELPPEELGPVPVTIVEPEPRWYGVTPQSAVLAVALAAAGVGIALLALGSTVTGAVLLGLGVLLLAVVVRAPIAEALAGPAEVGRTAISMRLSSGGRLAALRRELDLIARERDAGLRALGSAVYGGEDGSIGPLRAQLEELDRREREAQAEIALTIADAGERIRVARLGTARTEAVSIESRDERDR